MTVDISGIAGFEKLAMTAAVKGGKAGGEQTYVVPLKGRALAMAKMVNNKKQVSKIMQNFEEFSYISMNQTLKLQLTVP